MKFWKVAVLSLLFCSAAQADFLTGLLDVAMTKANHEKMVQKQADELVERALKVRDESEAAARPYANELLDEAAKLSILAQSSNGGMGKDLSYAESGLNKKLPCEADLYATKEGVVTLTLNKKCNNPNTNGPTISLWDVQRNIEYSGENVYCEHNICQIDFKIRK